MQQLDKTSLVIIDDHPLFRQGVEDVFRLERDFEVVGTASSGQEGLALIRSLKPQVGITDINLPDLSGLAVVKQVKQESLLTRLILLTAYDDPAQKLYAFQSGAWGYCTKDIQPVDLVDRVRAVASGYYVVSSQIMDEDKFNHWLDLQMSDNGQTDHLENFCLPSPLSPRELEILIYLTQGQSNKEIAMRLGISHQTVKNHLASLFRKLGVQDRTQAVLFALQRGLVKMSLTSNGG